MYKYFFGIKVGYSWEYPGINVAPPMLLVKTEVETFDIFVYY